ncbi:MAG: dTDP-glucose pyrophosphorylase [Thaumarchaeota archaeon]|nr:dTDP-glucose pyrophosphorylase [Nitrososphaerota archaeon]
MSHAIKLCRDFIKNDRFVVYLGDNILRKGLVDYTKKFNSSTADALILLCEVDDPTRFGVVELDGSKIKKIVEKPKNPPSNLAVIGVYFLTPKIFDIIDNLKPSWRGELEITDALDMLLNSGNVIEYSTVTGWWKDTGTPEDILHANQLVLDTIGTPNQFLISNDSKVQGNIIVGKNTTISRDSFVTGPAIIGDNCTIGPSVRLGPYVSVGNNVSLKKCDIENSIVMQGAKIDAKIHLVDSIISHQSEIEDHTHPKKHQFLLGERSQVRL